MIDPGKEIGIDREIRNETEIEIETETDKRGRTSTLPGNLWIPTIVIETGTVMISMIEAINMIDMIENQRDTKKIADLTQGIRIGKIENIEALKIKIEREDMRGAEAGHILVMKEHLH